MFDWMDWFRHVSMSMLIGMLAEWIAVQVGLWFYRSRAWLVSNVVSMFGLAMGTVSASGLTLPEQIIVAGTLGLAYEWVNTGVLKAWHFPQQRWAWLPGPYSIGVLLALAWAMVPILVAESVSALYLTGV